MCIVAAKSFDCLASSLRSGFSWLKWRTWKEKKQHEEANMSFRCWSFAFEFTESRFIAALIAELLGRYEIDEPMALYGAIPIIWAIHRLEGRVDGSVVLLFIYCFLFFWLSVYLLRLSSFDVVIWLAVHKRHTHTNQHDQHARIKPHLNLDWSTRKPKQWNNPCWVLNVLISQPSNLWSYIVA